MEENQLAWRYFVICLCCSTRQIRFSVPRSQPFIIFQGVIKSLLDKGFVYDNCTKCTKITKQDIVAYEKET